MWKFGLDVPCSEAKSKAAFDCSPNGEIFARCPIEIREDGMNDVVVVSMVLSVFDFVY